MWFVSLVGFAFADEAVDPFSEPDEALLFKQERQVVTVAARYAQTVEQAPSIVTLITAEDILQLGYRTLSDALRSIPGVYIASSKESRQLAWVRGVTSTDNNKILLLIDGVPWYDGAYTHAWIDEYIPLFNVQQIEVIKGPGSAIYGTNAFAGVINVVTRDGASQYSRFHLSTGSFARREIATHFADTLGDNIHIGGYARYMESDGDGLDVSPKGKLNLRGANPRRAINGGGHLKLNNFEVRYDFVDFRHTYYVNPQYDLWQVMLESPDEFNLSYRNDFVTLEYNQKLGRFLSIKPYLFAQSFNNSSLYAYMGEPATQNTYTVGEITPQERGASNPLNINSTESIYIPRTIVQPTIRTFHYGAGLEGTVRPNFEHLTLFGVGVDANKVAQLEDLTIRDGSDTPVYPSEFSAPRDSWITDIFAFAQHTWTATWWLEVNMGLRFDTYYTRVYEQSKISNSSLSPRIGVLMVPYSDTSIKILYGRAFRAPNAREWLLKIQPNEAGETDYYNGNLDLISESIDTIEAEFSSKLRKDLKIRGSLFYSRMMNEINKTVSEEPHPELGRYYYKNIGQAKSYGGEAEVIWRPRNFISGVSYSFIRSEDEETGNATYEFPPHMAHLRLGWSPFPKLWINLRSDIYGVRPREQWTQETGLLDGPAFGLVHLTISSAEIQESVRISASVYNLLNQPHDYLIYLDDAVEMNSSNQPKYPNDLEGEGRAFYLSATAQF